MDGRTVPASTFKQKCLALLDQVAMTKVPLIVTKHGRPVARVVALEEDPRRSTEGSVTVLSEDEEELFSTGVGWPQPEPPG